MATVISLARDHVEFQMLRAQAEFAAARDCDTVEGWVLYPDLVFPSWGLNPPKPPEGFAWVEQRYNPQALERMWKTVRNNRIAVQLLVGIEDGKLVACNAGFFVDKAQKNAVLPEASTQQGYRQPTQEELAEHARERGVELWSKRLAVGPFAGTPLEGRALWLDGYDGNPRSHRRDGVEGWLVPVHVFVTEEQVAAQVDAAGERYEQDKRERAEREEARRKEREAREKRAAELEEMAPPAVVVIDGEAWMRAEDGTYAVPHDEDAFAEDWQHLLTQYGPDEIDLTYADRAQFDAEMAAAQREAAE